MIIESRMQEYRDALEYARDLAKTHDCKFYVYDMDGKYQTTSTMDSTRKLAGEAYPGGRIIAHALMPGKVGGVRL